MRGRGRTASRRGILVVVLASLALAFLLAGTELDVHVPVPRPFGPLAGTARPSPRPRLGLHVAGAVPCELNCTATRTGVNASEGECARDPSIPGLALLDALGEGPAPGEVGSIGRTRGPPELVACQVTGALCLQLVNDADTVVRIRDLGGLSYGFGDGAAPGWSAIPPSSAGLTITGPDGAAICCRLDEAGATGSCGGWRSIPSGGSFVIGSLGSYRDREGRALRLTHERAVQDGLAVALELPALGARLVHRVVDGGTWRLG